MIFGYVSEAASCMLLFARKAKTWFFLSRSSTEPSVKALGEIFLKLFLGCEKGFPDNAKFSLSFTKTPGICQKFSPWSKIVSGVEKQEHSLLCTMVFV